MPDLYQAKQMHELFVGAEKAHGQFTPKEMDGKKVKGEAITKRETVTDQLWLRHLDGELGLGIIPIDEDSNCRWGVIDVDDYDLDFIELLNKIRTTPLVCCKSKSGGAWLFIFIKQAVPAKQVKDYLLATASGLGLSPCDIFPRQEKVYSERGDVGNWLNMPYFGPSRYCNVITDAGSNGRPIKELTLEEFISHAKERMVDGDFFLGWRQALTMTVLQWNKARHAYRLCQSTESLSTAEILSYSMLASFYRSQSLKSGKL